MDFRTKIEITTQQGNQLDYTSKVLLLGSCFSENIGNKLDYFLFNTLINPFGVLFSPTAIEKALKDTIAQSRPKASNLVQQGELFHSLYHHSDLSGTDEQQVLNNIQQAQSKCLAQLKQASHVVITLGTSWVYTYQKNKELVANCHKISQNKFEKKMLSVDEIQTSLNSILHLVKSTNPTTQVIFTVSPVRHTKEGLTNNAISKAHLLAAAHSFKNTSNISYFGSYEIMMDDLRDYRFYKADMIHPNEVAIDYIWNLFSDTWISKKAHIYFKRIHSIRQGLQHKSLHENTLAHKSFLEKLALKKSALETELNVKF